MIDGMWIPGNPVTYSTSKEKEWKETIEQTLHDVPIPVCDGVTMAFSLKSFSRNGHPFDLDNLCVPVFSVLVGSLGWFASNKQNIKWWRAYKKIDSNSGLTIWAGDQDGINDSKRAPDFYDEYIGPFPSHARDMAFIEWVRSKKTSDIPNFSTFHLELQFGGNRINIAEIVTGTVKHIIDCLYPILGGSEGAPEDWRVDCLEVTKGVDHIDENGVRIMIWGS